MTFLLDTNVVSELRKPRPHGAVLRWINQHPESHLRLSVVTLGEIQSGIERTRDLNPAKAAELEAWLDELAAQSHVLPLDTRVMRTWARLLHRKSDHHIEDALIAATALVHGLTVATRNTADFRIFGVALINPFA